MFYPRWVVLQNSSIILNLKTDDMSFEYGMSNNRAGIEGLEQIEKNDVNLRRYPVANSWGRIFFHLISKGYCANLAHMLYIKTVTPQFHENLCHFGMVLFGVPARKNVIAFLRIKFRFQRNYPTACSNCDRKQFNRDIFLGTALNPKFEYSDGQ